MSEIRQAVWDALEQFWDALEQFWDALEQFWNDVRNALEQVTVTVHRAARRAFGYRPGEQAAPQGEEKAVEETPGRIISMMLCSQCSYRAYRAELEEETPGRISEGSYRSAHRLPECCSRCARPRPWGRWYEARERYAKPGSNDAAREVAMADLLSYVTADNPPAADPLPVYQPVPPSRAPRWCALALGLGGWEFLVFGLAFYPPLLLVAMCCFVAAAVICFGWRERF